MVEISYKLNIFTQLIIKYFNKHILQEIFLLFKQKWN